MLAAQPCAAAFYGTEVTQLTAAQQTQLAGAAMHVLWGFSRKRRCREIVFTLFAPGHLVDPQQALTYRRLVASGWGAQFDYDLAISGLFVPFK